MRLEPRFRRLAVSKFYSRKWQLVVFFSLVATVGLFLDRIDGGQWVTIATVIVGAYSAANAAAKFAHAP